MKKGVPKLSSFIKSTVDLAVGYRRPQWMSPPSALRQSTDFVRSLSTLSATVRSNPSLFPLTETALLRSTAPAVSRTGIRHMSRYSSSAVLERAEATANQHPEDPMSQAHYMSALNAAKMYTEVIRRFDSGRFATHHPSVIDEYVRALVQSRAISESDYAGEVAQLRSMHLRDDPYGNPAGSHHLHSSYSPGGGGIGGGAGGAGGLAGLSMMGGGGGMGAGAGSPPGSGSGFPSGSALNPLVVSVQSKSNPMDFVITLLRAGLLGALLFLLYKTLNGGKSGVPGNPLEALTGNSAEELHDVPDTRFKDVKGIDEARDELEDIVDFLRDPDKYTRLGAKVPRGVLLTGPPGTGKTLLARAVAGEAGVPFYSRSASEFEEMLVGLGAKRVRELFASAKEHAPAIIFIDEIDAMGGKRGRVSVGHSSERQTLNQLLSCMDGFSKNEGVIVLAATNSPDILDSALTRPGRFDTKVAVHLPDKKGRKEIVELYLTKVIHATTVNADLIAAATPGFSGADLEALINSAALLAANRGAAMLEMVDLEEARDKIIMGPARRSKVQRKEVLRMTAFHEAGHTLAALLSEHAAPIHKVTILPRGRTGGATHFLPDHRDEGYETKAQILAQIDVAMGGRVAEELLLGLDHVTTGAGMDMAQASELARRFCSVYSMSDLGLTSYAQTKPSPTMQAEIDKEVERILTDAYARVKAQLQANFTQLERLAEALLEYETLDAEQCKAAVAGKPLPGITPGEKDGASGDNSSSMWNRWFGGGGGGDNKAKGDEVTEHKPAPAASSTSSPPSPAATTTAATAAAAAAAAAAASVGTTVSTTTPPPATSMPRPNSAGRRPPPPPPPPASRPPVTPPPPSSSDGGSSGEGGSGSGDGRRWV